MAELAHLLRSNAKFKHLQLLAAIGDMLHVGQVADRLHLSQPAVSKALAELESLVGAKLFQRTSRGLVATEQGKLFVQFARETLARLDRLAEDSMDAQLGLGGTIHVGSLTTATALLVPLSIGLLKQSAPTTTVRIDDGLMEPLLERLRLGELDLVIGRLDAVPEVTGLALESLYLDEVVAVVSYDSPLAQQRDISWSRLAEHPWTLPPAGSFVRSRFDELSRQSGMPRPRDVVETSSFLAMVTLLRERGAVCLMSSALAHYCERVQLARVLSLSPVHLNAPVGIIRIEGRRERPGVAHFSECLRLAARGQAMGGTHAVV